MSKLAAVVQHATTRQQQPGPVLRTRKPTGKPPWPMILLAGGEKAGKSYSAAVASASEHISNTYWMGVGEDDPDEYGAIPGARFEILEHDGTYAEIVQQLAAAVQAPAEPGKPNLIVFDSASRMWDMLSEEAQTLANMRRKQDGAQITMDLWNRATSRWNTIMNILRAHKGPVILTARLETVTVMDDGGQPTKEKTEKVKGQKGLPFDVGVVVQMPRRGETYLTGVRSLRVDIGPDKKEPVKQFAITTLWRDMGVLEEGGTSDRIHSHGNGEASAHKEPDWPTLFNEARGDKEKLVALRERAQGAGLPPDFGMFGAIEAELVALEKAS